MTNTSKSAGIAGRLYYVDNLRTLLAVFVIMVHLASTYSGVGFWAYHERPTDDFTYYFLINIIIFGHAFIVSTFFMISGYFSARSIEKKSFFPFIWGKLVRLGLPFLMFYYLLSPYGYFIKHTQYITFGEYWEFLMTCFETNDRFRYGASWFLVALIMFDALFSFAFIWLRKKKVNMKLPFSRIVILLLILSVVTYVVRIWHPIHSAEFGFRFANFPRYVFFYVIGALAFKSGFQLEWGRNSQRRTYISLIVISLTMALALIFFFDKENQKSFMGGANYYSFFYSFWETLASFTIGVGLLVLFRKYFNFSNPVIKFFTDNAFTVFIIHTPVLLTTAVKLRHWQVSGTYKFFVALVISLVLTFGFSFLINSFFRSPKLLYRKLVKKEIK
jgi:fucose 4-O-acetylase-like acetyltransferase